MLALTFLVASALGEPGPTVTEAQAPAVLSDPTAEASARKRAKELHKLAIAAETAGDKAAASAAREAAKAAYEAWLASWDGTGWADDMRVAYAALLFANHEFGRSYDVCMRVAEVNAAEAMRQGCLEQAIFAMDELMHQQAHRGERPEILGSLTPEEVKQLAALDLYVRLYPSAPQTRQVRYKAAYLLYNRGIYAAAAARFRDAIALEPGTKDAEQAANLVLDGLVEVKDWRAVAEYAQLFHDQRGLGDARFKSEMLMLVESARATDAGARP